MSVSNTFAGNFLAKGMQWIADTLIEVQLALSSSFLST